MLLRTIGVLNGRSYKRSIFLDNRWVLTVKVTLWTSGLSVESKCIIWLIPYYIHMYRGDQTGTEQSCSPQSLWAGSQSYNRSCLGQSWTDTQMLTDTDFLVQSCWCSEKELKVMIRLNPPQLFSLIGYVEMDTPHEIQSILWVVSMRVCLQMCHRLLILPLALRLKLCSLWCSSSPRGVPASLIRSNLSPTPVHL